MQFLKKLNPLKRKLFKSLTASFKNSKNLKELSSINPNKVTRILLVRPNHRLGNQLLLSPLIQVLHHEFPHAKVDLVVNGGISDILYANYPNVNHVYNLPKKPFKNLGNYIEVSYKIISTKYTLAIAGESRSNSGKIFLKLSRSKFKIFNCGSRPIQAIHMAKKPIDNLRFFLCKNQLSISNNYPKIDLKLTDKEISKGRQITQSCFKNNLPIIAIFTNATGDKKLSKAWWNDFTATLIKAFPNTNILEILPKENTSQVDFKHPYFYSKDLREIAAVIENCSLYLSADCGIMHLATATNTPTVGLFNGTTNPEIYAPYGEENKFAININKLASKEVIELINNKNLGLALN